MTQLAVIFTLALALAAPALADTAPTPKAETCQSCNARHNALKKLQDARVPVATPQPATPTEKPPQKN